MLNWSNFLSLANGTWCAVTVPSYDFVKDDCAVRSAVLGKRGYNLSGTQLMVLFHLKPTEKKVFWADRKRSNGFFDGVRNVAVCIYYSRKRVSDYCIFNFWCLVLTQKSSHTSQKDETTWYFVQFIIKAKVCKIEVCFKHSVEAYVFK